MASPLAPESRAATLVDLERGTLDLLVIGGGITGAGIARDAVLRGLAVGLVEAVDFAAGTSSRSSKLIHGGVRYLQQGDIGLVREAALERQRLRGIAPHLARSLLMVMPTYKRTTHAKLAVGLFAFDKIASIGPEERHELWDHATALEREPALARDGLFGAAAFTEYLTDDARLVLATIRSAVESGARCVNHVRAEAFHRAGPHATVTVRDTTSGATHTIRARVVVNAGGPWVDTVREAAGARHGRQLHLTKGIHLVVPHTRLPLRHAVVMTAHDKRSVFAVPRGTITYLGTTDTNTLAPVLDPSVTRADTDYLLDAARRTFAGTPLTRADVTGTWAGLRPLLHEEGKAPSEISRKDEIMVDAASGLVSIAGGKLTTYRRMAERVVDLVCERLGRPPTPSVTADHPLPGGDIAPAALPDLVRRIATALPGLDAEAIDRLVFLYGTASVRIAERATADAGAAVPLPGLPYVLRAELDHVLDEEMALGLSDVLERRLRVLYFDAHQGLDAAGAVALIVAQRLGWSEAERQRELAAYETLARSLRSFPHE